MSILNFGNTRNAAVRLQSALENVAPVATTPHAAMWLSALAAIAPNLTVPEVLGAWPLNATPRQWWNLLTNLGCEMYTTPIEPGTDERVCWCWLRSDGDIWLTLDTQHVWKSRSGTSGQLVGGLTEGNWVQLVLRDKPRNVPVTPSEILLGCLRPIMPSLLLGSLMVQGLGILIPVIIMTVYDHVIDGRAPIGYNALLVGVIAILTTEALLRRIRGKLLVRAGLRAETLWVNRLVAQLIHLPAGLVERASLSSQLSRLRGVDIFRDMATSPIVLGLLEIPFITIVLIALFLIAGQLVLIPLALVGAYLLLMVVCLPWVKSVLRRQATTTELQQSLVLEASQNQLTLRADGLSDIWLGRIESNGRQARNVTATATFMQHVLEVVSMLAGSIAGLLTLTMGMAMVQSGSLSAGGLVAAMMLVWRMLAPLSLLATALPRLVQVLQTALQLSEFLNYATETPAVAPPSPSQLPQPTPRGDIAISGVSLRYMRDHATVLNNLSLTISPGQLVTVMGANGSGKSSLLKILAGLYPVQAGVIRLDGIDTRQWDPERLRSHIAYLPQQPDMLDDTIAANLRLANPLATDAHIWEALERADAAEVVRQLDHGINQPLFGLDVPEFFHHQLSLARLYLNTAPIVLCDELPAALMNTPAGQAFTEWLLQQNGQRTVLAVSHAPRLANAAALGIGLRTENTALVGPATQVLRHLNTPVSAATLHLVQPAALVPSGTPASPTLTTILNGASPHAA